MTNGVVSFNVYEDAVKLLGLAEVTLPNINYKTLNITGAGLSGDIEAVIAGVVDAMTMRIKFLSRTDQAISLAEPRIHDIDLRVAEQMEDTASGKLSAVGHKHMLRVIPKSLSGQTIAPASEASVDGEYAVRSWTEYVDGKKVTEIDPANIRCVINGVDYLADVRKALGE